MNSLLLHAWRMILALKLLLFVKIIIHSNILGVSDPEFV